MSKPQPLATRLSSEEREILRWIGGQLSRIIQGDYREVPRVPRRDELGILANMAARVADELRRSRERDEAHRREREQRIEELERARREQQRLLDTIEELSTPILAVHRGVLLLPIIGSIGAARAARVTETLLSRVVEAEARVVILDVTGASAIDEGVAGLLRRAAEAVSLLGARVILCGVRPALARMTVELGLDLSSLSPQRDLAGALSAALRIAGDDPRRG
ncbi:MAG: STAS domain-containing protein [Polyangiaceae bacterium]|nr:STAS domain-containing protein [Polyangiaceae bacterium]